MSTTKTSVLKDIPGLRRITKKDLLAICKKNDLYQTPELNDVLYLHYQGYQDIEGLEEYTGLKCLWLECNAISEIAGLENQKKLKCLFLQNNLVKKIENLEFCPELDTLNLSHNHVFSIENCGTEKLPVLTNLNLSHNYLKTYDSLKGLMECKTLTVLDLSHNRIEDALAVKVFGAMPKLRVLVLQGNPVVGQIPQYRKTLILECKNLTYLDSRPVFPKDRACAEAWKRGGYEAERAEHDRWKREEQRKTRDSINAMIRMRNRHGKEQMDLITSDDEKSDGNCSDKGDDENSDGNRSDKETNRENEKLSDKEEKKKKIQIEYGYIDKNVNSTEKLEIKNENVDKHKEESLKNEIKISNEKENKKFEKDINEVINKIKEGCIDIDEENEYWSELIKNDEINREVSNDYTNNEKFEIFEDEVKIEESITEASYLKDEMKNEKLDSKENQIKDENEIQNNLDSKGIEEIKENHYQQNSDNSEILNVEEKNYNEGNEDKVNEANEIKYIEKSSENIINNKGNNELKRGYKQEIKINTDIQKVMIEEISIIPDDIKYYQKYETLQINDGKNNKSQNKVNNDKETKILYRNDESYEGENIKIINSIYYEKDEPTHNNFINPERNQLIKQEKIKLNTELNTKNNFNKLNEKYLKPKKLIEEINIDEKEENSKNDNDMLMNESQKKLTKNTVEHTAIDKIHESDKIFETKKDISKTFETEILEENIIKVEDHINDYKTNEVLNKELYEIKTKNIDDEKQNIKTLEEAELTVTSKHLKSKKKSTPNEFQESAEEILSTSFIYHDILDTDIELNPYLTFTENENKYNEFYKKAYDEYLSYVAKMEKEIEKLNIPNNDSKSSCNDDSITNQENLKEELNITAEIISIQNENVINTDFENCDSSENDNIVLNDNSSHEFKNLNKNTETDVKVLEGDTLDNKNLKPEGKESFKNLNDQQKINEYLKYLSEPKPIEPDCSEDGKQTDPIKFEVLVDLKNNIAEIDLDSDDSLNDDDNAALKENLKVETIDTNEKVFKTSSNKQNDECTENIDYNDDSKISVCSATNIKNDQMENDNIVLNNNSLDEFKNLNKNNETDLKVLEELKDGIVDQISSDDDEKIKPKIKEENHDSSEIDNNSNISDCGQSLDNNSSIELKNFDGDIEIDSKDSEELKNDIIIDNKNLKLKDKEENFQNINYQEAIKKSIQHDCSEDRKETNIKNDPIKEEGLEDSKNNVVAKGLDSDDSVNDDDNAACKENFETETIDTNEIKFITSSNKQNIECTENIDYNNHDSKIPVCSAKNIKNDQKEVIVLKGLKNNIGEKDLDSDDSLNSDFINPNTEEELINTKEKTLITPTNNKNNKSTENFDNNNDSKIRLSSESNPKNYEMKIKVLDGLKDESIELNSNRHDVNNSACKDTINTNEKKLTKTSTEPNNKCTENLNSNKHVSKKIVRSAFNPQNDQLEFDISKDFSNYVVRLEYDSDYDPDTESSSDHEFMYEKVEEEEKPIVNKINIDKDQQLTKVSDEKKENQFSKYIKSVKNQEKTKLSPENNKIKNEEKALVPKKCNKNNQFELFNVPPYNIDDMNFDTDTDTENDDLNDEIEAAALQEYFEFLIKKPNKNVSVRDNLLELKKNCELLKRALESEESDDSDSAEIIIPEGLTDKIKINEGASTSAGSSSNFQSGNAAIATTIGQLDDDDTDSE